jgi:hypothetical protein
MSEGATWLASYPKSGNTWLRCLLEAYRRNGALDINDIRISSADASAGMVQGISPLPLTALGLRGELLLRPAALLNQFARLSQPIVCKTHFANIQPDGLPPLIPFEFTKNAVYVVRDPRSVALSMSKFYQFTTEKTVQAMASKEFVIGGDEKFARCMLSSWSNHVASWTSETRYPVHIVRYEDMVTDTAKEIIEVLEFMEIEVDTKLVAKAIEAADISKLKASEESGGFKENMTPGKGAFFTAGGTRWQEELGKKWAAQIVEDHGEVMQAMQYLDAESKLKAVQ